MAGWDLPATPALAPGAGNLTTHLRKLEDAGYLVVTNEFRDLKLRTWVQATPADDVANVAVRQAAIQWGVSERRVRQLAGRRARPHTNQRSTATVTALG